MTKNLINQDHLMQANQLVYMAATLTELVIKTSDAGLTALRDLCVTQATELLKPEDELQQEAGTA